MARIADPKEKQERLVQELAVKRAKLAQAEEVYKKKKAELDEQLAPLLEAKKAAEEAAGEIQAKLETEFIDLDKSELHNTLNRFDRRSNQNRKL
jgi:thermostable 8-oxoguanine DNA glycosylase